MMFEAAKAVVREQMMMTETAPTPNQNDSSDKEDPPACEEVELEDFEDMQIADEDFDASPGKDLSDSDENSDDDEDA